MKISIDMRPLHLVLILVELLNSAAGSSESGSKSPSESSRSSRSSRSSEIESDLEAESGSHSSDSKSKSRSGSGSSDYGSYHDSSHSSEEWNCECGKRNKKGKGKNRIIGGSETRAHEYPWLVRIAHGCVGFTQNTGMCTGALISDRHIITAYHCLGQGKPCDHSDGRRVAYIGAHYVDFNRQESPDARYILPLTKFETPPYAGKLPYRKKHLSAEDKKVNDLAVYVLEKPVKFSETVYPICLPKRERDYGGKRAIAAGWGDYRRGYFENSFVLRSVELEVMKAKSVFETLFFTKTEKNEKGEWKDPCSGDSGGPLMYKDKKNDGRYTLIGVVHGGGYNCDRDKLMQGHVNTDQKWTDVSYFSDYLKDLLKDDKADMCAFDH